MPGDQRSELRARIEIPVVLRYGDDVVATTTGDLSKGGAFVRTDARLALRTEVDLELRIPQRDSPVEVHGRVAWVAVASARAEDAPAGVGVMFVWEDANDRRTFETAIAPMLTGEVGAADEEAEG